MKRSLPLTLAFVFIGPMAATAVEPQLSGTYTHNGATYSYSISNPYPAMEVRDEEGRIRRVSEYTFDSPTLRSYVTEHAAPRRASFAASVPSTGLFSDEVTNVTLEPNGVVRGKHSFWRAIFSGQKELRFFTVEGKAHFLDGQFLYRILDDGSHQLFRYLSGRTDEARFNWKAFPFELEDRTLLVTWENATQKRLMAFEITPTDARVLNEVALPNLHYYNPPVVALNGGTQRLFAVGETTGEIQVFSVEPSGLVRAGAVRMESPSRSGDESIRSIALHSAPDRTLLAVGTEFGRLAVFALTPQGLTPIGRPFISGLSAFEKPGFRSEGSTTYLDAIAVTLDSNGTSRNPTKTFRFRVDADRLENLDP